MKFYQTKLIPALKNGLNALSDEVGRPVRGENVLLMGLQRAIDRRVSIEALLDASADFIGLHGLSEQSLQCLALVKTVIAHDDYDANVYSIHVIFSSKNHSIVRQLAKESGVPLSQAKRFLTKQRLIKALVEEAANHYLELYSRYTSMRKDLGAEDNSTDIYALIDGKIIRCNWTHPTQSVFASICGGNIANARQLPMSSLAWESFLKKRLLKEVKKQAPKPKPEPVEAERDDDDNDDELTLNQFGKKHVTKDDASEVINEDGCTYQYGILKIGANGCVNPYFNSLVRNKKKQMGRV